MKCSVKIIQNYIVFDEVIPPTPERKQRKKAERRGEADIKYDFVMEIGNTKEFTRAGKPIFYHKRRIASTLKHFHGYPKRYYLISHASALKLTKDKLAKMNVKILEIGSQVTPRNLVGIYPKVRSLIDKHIPDKEKEKSDIIILREPQKQRYKED